MLPAGYSARSLTFHDVDGLPDSPDVDLACEVVCAADAEIIGTVDESREATRSGLTSPDAVREEHRLILDADGRSRGLLMVERDEGARTVFLEAYAVPGTASAILTPILQMGVEAADRLRGEGDWHVEAGTFAQDATYIAALTAFGFAPVRRFWRMRVDLTPEHASEPPAPPGVTRTTVSTDDDRRHLHAIDQISFAEHFGFTPRSYDEFMPWLDDRRDARPDLWWLAWHEGTPVGICVMDDSRAEQGATYVRILGVIPEARGRGIASWLLRSAFAQAAREGRPGVMLTVDSENVTGATALYEGVGMRPQQVIDLYRRPL